VSVVVDVIDDAIVMVVFIPDIVIMLEVMVNLNSNGCRRKILKYSPNLSFSEK